jgi:polyisoprenoid-binding protein YceI
MALFIRRNDLLQALAIMLSSVPASAADLYTLDPDHTQTIFTINHLGYSIVTGNFHDIKGTLRLDERKPEASSVEVTIGTANVDTGVVARDDDLRSAEFFNVAKFPAMNFKSTRVKKKGAQSADVTGHLTLLGVTKPVTLKVTFNRMAPDFLRANKTVAGFTATTTIRRSDFGMTTFLPLIGDEVHVAISAEGIRE